MATNRTTTTVAVRLDLAELIGQLRNLADTLEATQRPRLTVKAEDAECKHEAWDVHANGITRRCSDCRAPLPALEPGTCHCGAKPLFALPTQHGQLAVDLANENTTAAADFEPLRCRRCDDPWHPREICPACGCDNYRKNNPK